jgi:tetratricopeptide (TPR) repeat protein
MRFGNACARNWAALDRTGRLFVACLGAVSLCFALLAIAGWSRKPSDEARGVSGDGPSGSTPSSLDDQTASRTRPLPAGDAGMERGEEALRKRDWDSAVLEFTAAIQKNPRNADAYSLRGEAYYWNGNASSSITDCTSAIHLNPHDARAYVIRGAVYVNQKRLTQAMMSFDEAVRITPDDASLYAARGAIYANQKHFTQAMTNFDEGVRIAPDDARLRCWRARCALAWVTGLWREGRGWQEGHGSDDAEIDRLLRRGLDDCKESLRLNPTFTQAKEFAESLEQGLKAGKPSGGQGFWAYPMYDYQLDDPLVLPKH